MAAISHPIYFGISLNSIEDVGRNIQLSTTNLMHQPVAVRVNWGDDGPIDENKWVSVKGILAAEGTSSSLVNLNLKISGLAKLFNVANKDITDARDRHEIESFIWKNLSHRINTHENDQKTPSIPSIPKLADEKIIKRVLSINYSYWKLSFEDFESVYKIFQLANCALSQSFHLSRRDTQWSCSVLNFSPGIYGGTYIIIKGKKRGVTQLDSGGSANISHAMNFQGAVYAFRTLPSEMVSETELKINEMLLQDKDHFVAGRAIEYTGYTSDKSGHTDEIRPIPKIGFLMPYKQGGELIDFYNRFMKNNKYSNKNVLPMAHQIAYKLHLLHTKYKIVHLDFKLENILLDVDLNLLNPNIKLYDISFNLSVADFGTAAFVGSEVKHEGSPGYLDPSIESIGAVFQAECSYDIWSLGVCLATLKHGPKFDFWTEQREGNYDKLAKMPHREFSKHKAEFFPNRDESDSIDWIINRCLRLNPEKRPSALKVANFIEGLIKFKKSSSW